MNKIEELEIVVNTTQDLTKYLTELYAVVLSSKNNGYKKEKQIIENKYAKKMFVFSLIDLPLIVIMVFLTLTKPYMFIPLFINQFICHFYLNNLEKKCKEEQNKKIEDCEKYRNDLFEVVESSRKKYHYLSDKLEEEKQKQEFSDKEEYNKELDEFFEYLSKLTYEDHDICVTVCNNQSIKNVESDSKKLSLKNKR